MSIIASGHYLSSAMNGRAGRPDAYDFSYQSEIKQIGISSREFARQLRKPDEIFAQERGKAWVFVRGMRPMELSMAHYGQVSPWQDWVRDNPIEGKALRDEALFHIHYPERTE